MPKINSEGPSEEVANAVAAGYAGLIHITGGPLQAAPASEYTYTPDES